jgi:diadenosine tetraphosphatase ApaH/serine/threonine PP2A family protein phosphatase
VPFSHRLGPKLIGNPGSIGQPRDGEPRASYAILEPSAETKFQIHRVSYDMDAAATKITARGLPTLLAERLYIGF